jgi:D-amino-acid oxidase
MLLSHFNILGKIEAASMTIDRRMILAAVGGSLFAKPVFGQSHPIIKEAETDGGKFLPTPNFTNILRNIDTVDIPYVAGLRPERRVNGSANVRLEVDTSVATRLVIHNYGHFGAGVTLGLGCASFIERRLAAQQDYSKNSKITIVGAGVIGLTTAYVLKRRGYRNLEIVAPRISSGDFDLAATVSDIAGGQFDAAGINDVDGGIVGGGNQSERKLNLLSETLNLLTERRGRGRDTFRPNGFYIYDVVRNYTTNPRLIPQALIEASRAVRANSMLKTLLEERYGNGNLPNEMGVVAPFLEIQASRKAPEPFTMGVCDTIIVNVPNFIKSLKRYLNSSLEGPVVLLKSGPQYLFQSIDDLSAINSDVVINCTGLAGAVTGGRTELGTVGGRYGILAKLPPLPEYGLKGTKRYLYSGFGYMFPRSDGLIIGGAWDDKIARPNEAPIALPQMSVSNMSSAAPNIKALYSNSLLGKSNISQERARTMVKAMAHYFLGQTDELRMLGPQFIEWISGDTHFPCAIDRAQCTRN